MEHGQTLAQAARSGAEDPYRKAILPEVEPIAADETLSDVMGKVAESPHPVPVVDAERRYVGAISKSTLLRTLDRSGN